MLKENTIKDLETVFNIKTELSELEIVPAPSVEIINLDLIRIHINQEARETTIIAAIVEILKNNSEKGPLKISPDIIKGTNWINFIDIIQI